MKIVAIIPARYASTRFKGKPLALILEKPMIRHVYEGVLQSKIVSDVIIATEDKRVYDAAKNFGANIVMTKDTHLSGTDRILEASLGIDADIILNIQGDEPLVNEEIITALVKPFKENKDILYTSVKTPIYSYEEFIDPNNVKVVVDEEDFGIYFSRSPIPYDRNCFNADFKLAHKKILFGYKHLGFYGYRKDFLLTFGNLPASYLEKKESLEQLRAIENGYKIKVETVNISTIPVDVPSDIKKVENYLLKLYNK
jgi:3-deoxy-manno-octulosonate cytidylyltransferase (CMP-KDO synthetase)